MRIRPHIMGVVIIVFFLGGIGITAGLNLWQTESSKIPVKYTQGQYAGSYNPADIRGSYTFGDVSRLFDVPLEELVIAFGLNDVKNIADFKNKDLESRYESLVSGDREIGNGSVKMFVALYKGLPYTLEEGTCLLSPAVEILKAQGNLTAEQLNFLERHTIEIDGINPKLGQNPTVSEEHDDEDEERVVKGKTTFKEVLDWGVSQAEIEEVLGKKMPNPLMNIRDFCLNEGLEFSMIKTALQAKITP